MLEPLNPERERLLLPYANDHQRSQQTRWNAAHRPRDINAYIRWARWAYGQEPPVRLHVRGLSDDGSPRWSGDFISWITGGEQASCGQDQEGFYRTPLRCAIFTMHGRFEDKPEAKMADFLLSIAGSHVDLATVCRWHGIAPGWVQPIVAVEALRRLWELYAPQPRENR